MKEIKFAVLLNAHGIPEDVLEEWVDSEISFHYQGDTFSIDWELKYSDEYNLPITAKWLLETYGEEIKKYESFAIIPT